MGADARIAELNLTLPPAPKPVATYHTAVRYGELMYVSGHGPLRPDGTMFTGKVGAELDLATGQAAARQVGLAILATLRDRLGTLDRVVRLVKVLGLVNCADDFTDQPKVINGFSDLMVEIFGESGRGARSAVGTNALPGNIAVEIEAIFEVKD
jgi:enamine deaminase RidA (YjgF/YER057c/UK114 family)